MPRYIHTNNASSRLLASINSSQTTLAVASGHGVMFPLPVPDVDDGFFVTVEDRTVGRIEIMHCTQRVGDTLTVVRGQQGTVPQSFSAGVNVSNRVTAGILNQLENFANDVVPLTQIPSIPDSKLTGLTAAKLTGTIDAARLPDIPPANLTSVPSASLTGTIAGERLPVIPTNKLPVIPPANLTSVPAASLTGTIAAARLPTIPANLLTSVPAASLTGTIAAARLPAIPSSLLPVIPANLLTSVPAASLTGTINAARLPIIPSTLLTSVPAASLTGTVVVARLPVDAGAVNWVLGRTAGTGVNAIGSYALCRTGDRPCAPNETRNGADLRFSAGDGTFTSSIIPAGVWRCMGFLGSSNVATLFVRIS